MSTKAATMSAQATPRWEDNSNNNSNKKDNDDSVDSRRKPKAKEINPNHSGMAKKPKPKTKPKPKPSNKKVPSEGESKSWSWSWCWNWSYRLKSVLKVMIEFLFSTQQKQTGKIHLKNHAAATESDEQIENWVGTTVQHVWPKFTFNLGQLSRN